MSLKVADLFADLSLRTSNFSAGLASVTRQMQAAGDQLSKAFGSKPQAELKKTAKDFQSFTWQVRSGIKDITRVTSGIIIAQGFYKMLNAIEGSISAIMGFSRELEQANVAFSTLLGSADKAKSFIGALQELAQDTSLTFESAEKGSRRLMAMGFAAESVIPIMRVLADATAVTGASAEQVERLSLALGQMYTKGKVMQQEINQLTEAGINARKYIADALGKSVEELGEIGDLNLPGTFGVQAILAGMQKDFGGAAKQLENTMTGILNRLGDQSKYVGSLIFKPVYEGVKNQLRGLSDLMAKMKAGLESGGLGGLLGALFPARLVPSIIVLIKTLKSLGQSFGLLWQGVKPIASLIGEIMLRSLEIILPIIAAVARMFAFLFKTMMNYPVIKGLVAALGALLIANTVRLAVIALAGAIRGLFIAELVGKAVLGLAAAIKTLAIAMARTPLIALVTVLTTVLLGLALSCQTVSTWLDNVASKIAGFTGGALDIGIDPTSQSEIDAWNKSLEEAMNGLNNTGGAAEETKKKLDDLFVASFDELYQIPDKLDDVAGGIGGLANFKMPTIPKITTGGAAADQGVDAAPIDKLKDILNKLAPFGKTPKTYEIKLKWPDIGPGTALAEALDHLATKIAIVTTAWGVLVRVLKPIVNPFGSIVDGVDWVINKVGQLKTALQQVSNWSFSDLFNKGTQSISGWFGMPEIGEWGKSVSGWFSKAGEIISQGWQTVVSGLQGAGSFTLGIPDMLEEATKSISGWFGRTAQQIGAGAKELGQNLVTGLKTGWASIGVAFSGLGEQISSALEGIGPAILGAFEGLGAKVYTAGKKIWDNFMDSLRNYDWETQIKVAIAAIGLIIIGALLTIPESIATAATAIIFAITSIFTLSGEAVAAETDETNKTLVSKWDTIKNDLSKKWDEIKTDSKKKWEEISKNIGDSVSNLWATLNTKWDNVKTLIFGKWDQIKATGQTTWKGIADTIGNQVSYAWSVLNTKWDNVCSMIFRKWEDLKSNASRIFWDIAGDIANAFESIEHPIRAAMNGVIRCLNGIIDGWNDMSFDIPSVWTPWGSFGGYSVGTRWIPHIPYLGEGGIITKDMIARIGERGNEGVIPLGGSSAQPFINSLAAQINSANGNGGSQGSQPILYVGTLIADEKSLRELKRKMDVIEIKETARRS